MQRFLNAARRARDHLRPRHHRGDQPRRPDLRPAERPRRATRSLITRDGAPLQHRPLADALRGDGRAAARRADQRRRRTAAGRVREAADAADAARVAGRTSPTRSARSTRSSGSSSWPTRRGVPVLVDGAQAVAAPAGRRAASSTATSTPSPATSCTARPASACCTARQTLLEAMPPYQGGGDMIQLGDVREDDLQRACRTSSRPARRTSPARIGLGAAIDYVRGARTGRPSPPTSTTC